MFNFGTNLGGKYFIKLIFDIKIEIGILIILDVPSFNFGTTFGLAIGKYFIKIIFDII